MDARHSAILKSIDPNINNKNVSAFESLSLSHDNNYTEQWHSIELLDDNEDLKITSEQLFLEKLNIPQNEKVKVVSIFGNTGEGKSHTLNKVFFDGRKVFRISPLQTSCTTGVWAMYDPNFKVICLDTEGLLGMFT